LKKYRSHKIVEAVKIAAAEIHIDGSATIAGEDEDDVFRTKPFWALRFQPEERGDMEPDLGYFVRYEDGYESWSPTKAFEEGYSPIIKGVSESNEELAP
jgi:hypothetical protein